MHQQGYRNNYGLGTTTEHGNALRQEKIQIVLGCLYNKQALIEAYGAYVNTWCGLSKKEADVAIQDFATGDTRNIHETMIAVGKADLAFRLTMQVRNKMVEAYQEVMRLQV